MKKITAFFLLVFVLTSNLAFAADDPVSNDFEIVPACVHAKDAESMCTWADLIAFANKMIRFMVFISASLAVLAFCYAGFLYLTAFGEMGKIEQAHHVFKTTLVGMFFVLCGWLIVATILKLLVTSDETGIKNFINFGSVQTIQQTSN